jgi:dihydroflavonol-4-reductase
MYSATMSENADSSTDICGIELGTQVLVTGATGFTGQVVTRKLCEAGLRVRAIARESSDLAPLAELDVDWVRGDVADAAIQAKAMAGVRYVFHMATLFRDGGASEEEHHRVHVLATQGLANLAAKTDGFCRFVHVSTVGVHGHIEGGAAVDETQPFKPGDAYQRTKAEAENWLHDFAPGAALSYSVIRPAAIFGPGDRRLLKLFRMARKPLFPLLGRGKCLYHLIHVDDLADAIIAAATVPAAEAEAFICGNPSPIPTADIARIVADELGHNLRVLRLPVWPFFALAALCEAVCKPLGIKPPIYRRRVAFFTKDRQFNTRKLRDVLGFTPKVGNEEGIRATARWYADHGWL